MTDAAIEDVNVLTARAEQWLRPVRPPRQAGTRHWGEGEFDVTVFHDLEPDVELAPWPSTWPGTTRSGTWLRIADSSVEYGGAGLTPTHDRAFTELEAGYDVPNDHELFAVTTHLVAPTIAVSARPSRRSASSAASCGLTSSAASSSPSREPGATWLACDGHP